MKRITALLLMISMILALAVGCQPASTASDNPAQASEQEGSAQAAQSDSGIIRGGTLYARRIGIVPINPMETIAPTIDKMVYGLFMETLLTSDGTDYSAQPGLAESWTYSDDGLVLEMKLREGVSFHDGDPLNAEAVVKTWELFRNEAAPHNQISLAASLDRVEAASEYVVKFYFTEPDSGFLKALTTPLGYVLSPSSIAKYQETQDPEVFAREGGTGPFVLEEMVDGEYVSAL